MEYTFPMYFILLVFSLMMALIESHNIQPPCLLVDKLCQLTYTLMDFSEFYRNKEKYATFVKAMFFFQIETASWHQCEIFFR
jgi:hypothetical protein